MNGEAPKLFDEQVLDDLHDILGDSILPIVELFLTDVPQSLREMREAVARNDLITVGRIAHGLKSSSATLGAMQISALASDLEHRLNGGETDLEVVEHGVDSIAQSFDQIRYILQAKQFK